MKKKTSRPSLTEKLNDVKLDLVEIKHQINDISQGLQDHVRQDSEVFSQVRPIIEEWQYEKRKKAERRQTLKIWFGRLAAIGTLLGGIEMFRGLFK